MLPINFICSLFLCNSPGTVSQKQSMVLFNNVSCNEFSFISQFTLTVQYLFKLAPPSQLNVEIRTMKESESRI